MERMDSISHLYSVRQEQTDRGEAEAKAIGRLGEV